MRPPVLLAVVLVLASACRSREPDFELLRGVQIDPELTCGRELDAEQLVRLADDQALFLGLDDPEPVLDSLQAAGAPEFLPIVDRCPTLTVAESYQRLYPCASDAAEASALLTSAPLDYTDVELVRESDRIFVFDAVDTVGFPGSYTVFHCNYVDEVSHALDKYNLFETGLRGAFAGGPTLDYDFISTFAALTFRTRMTRPIPFGAGYASSDLVYVGMDEELITDGLDLCADDVTIEREFVRLCATWIERDAVDGCESVYLGISRTIIEDDGTGKFHQTALVRQFIPGASRSTTEFGIPAYCGRN